MKVKCKDRSTARAVLPILAILAAALPPRPVSVLCIAPGGHVAIEDINAGCCSHRVLPAMTVHQHTNGLDLAGDCGNCVDLLLVANDRGALLQSLQKISACADGPSTCPPADTIFSLAREPGAKGLVDVGGPIPPATHLRC